jgi:hypothetical protein
MRIEKNIPIPALATRTVWPWKDMEIGDCARFEDRKTAAAAQARCHTYGAKNGLKFVSKTIDGVLHIWRVE